MPTLRPYQTEAIDNVREALRTHRSVLLQMVTGGGKSATAAQMLANVVRRGKRGVFMLHRQELADQTQETFDAFGIPYGMIAADYAPNPYQPIQIAMVPTLYARIKRGKPIPAFDLCVQDECHHCTSNTWTAVKQHWPRAKWVGLSATPRRTDGAGLADHYDAMVQGPPMSWMIENGYLSRYRVFAPSTPDLGGVHTKMGDYVKAEIGAAMDKPTITGDAIAHYLRLARGKRAIVFCVSIEHSKHVCAQFRAAGVVAWHVDGETDKAERRQAIAAFKAGHIQVLCNVDLFGEGVDAPGVEAVIMLRPTKSLGLYLQQVGRALRSAPGKPHALILDHAGNIARHGLPDDEREWSLEGSRDAGPARDTVATRTCPACFHCHRPGPPRCPSCGHVYEARERTVEHVEGDLAEVDVEAIREARKAEQRAAIDRADYNGTLERLIALGRQRQYRHPERWAAHFLSTVMGRKPAA